MTTLAQYERARAALAEATAVDQVLPLLDEVEHVKLYARQIRDQVLLAQATEFQLRAERRLGQIIEQARAAGLFRQGRQPKNPPAGDFSRPTLADAGIDKKLAERAKGRSSISEQAFELVVKQARERIAAGRAKIIEPDRTEEKKAQRADREASLAQRQVALPRRQYGVILADPEWRFEPYSRDSGMDRAADNHYPTSATAAIGARPVWTIAAQDCVLFLWATVPMLPQALEVMALWGFAYKSHCVWTKDKVGTGYWFRNAHELLLVGTKGNVPAPAPGTQWPSTVEGRVGKHSAKPERFYELIEAYFPNLPKIELNAREARPGWDAWGNEAPPLAGEHVSAPVDASGAAVHHDADGVVLDPEVESDGLDIPAFLDRRPVASPRMPRSAFALRASADKPDSAGRDG